MFETLGITIIEYQTWLLVFARIFTIFAVLPLFSNEQLDPRLKAFICFFISLICVKIVPPAKILPVEFIMLMFLVIKEVFIGLCIGSFCSFFFEAVRFAGNQVGQLMGINMAEMIDPLYDEQSEAMSELFNIFAILMLLSINGHHFFLKVLFESFYFIPLTTFNFPNQILPRFIEVLQQIFIIGIKLAAPMMIILLLVKTMIGLLNRMVQEADIFSIILVLDLLLGFYILQFYWPYFATMVNQQFFIYKKEVLEFVKLLGST